MPELRRAAEYSIEEICELFNLTYEGYVVPLHLTPEHTAAMLRLDSVDFWNSWVAVEDSQAIGLAMIARRGDRSRLAAFALAPSHRGKGLSKWLLRHVLDEARFRSDRQMELEVIIGNDAAEHLYEGSGFKRVSRLRGYSAGVLARSSAAEIVESTCEEMACAMLREGRSWSWQMAAESVLGSASPSRAWRYKSAYALTSDPKQPIVAARGFAGTDADLVALLQGLAATFGIQGWRVVPTMPEEIYPGVFEHAGFTEDNLHQWRMILTF